MVLAFFWGSYLLWRNIRLTSFKEDEIFDGLFASMFSSLFFARLVYVIFNFDKFGFNLVKFFLINGYPGLSLFGAVLGGLIGLYIYFSYKKISFLDTIDYFVAPFFLALAFGKLGSFFSGSEVGTKTSFFLSVKYQGFDGFRHVTPLYETLVFAFAIYLTWQLLFLIRKQRLKHGFVLYFGLWYLAFVYFLFDKMKQGHLYFMGQSVNGLISVIVLLTLSCYFIYYFRSSIWYSFKLYGNKAFSKITKGFWRPSFKRSKKTPGTDHKA